jgi:CubicO group peptidase (beta-lactamase class C family)
VSRWRVLPLAVAIGCATKSAPLPSQESRDLPPTAVYPGTHWTPIASPEAEGYSSPKLDGVRVFLRDLDTTAVIVTVHGRVLFEYGDVKRVSSVTSVRKSVLAMLFGTHVAHGEIRESATLAQLGIDDVGGLSPEEKQATVDDLLAARSGVYHPASNPGDDFKDAPARGSKLHGTWFLYSNWDFNVLGTIFERQTHEDIYDALDRELARPVGMEDFKRAEQAKASGDAVSQHLAYPMNLSTRDMARLGYLMLRGGLWNGHDLVPSDWVTKLVTPTSRVEDVHGYEKWGLGYGKLWWLFDDPPSRAGGPLQGGYCAIGAYGQFITVLPRLDMVIAHKVVHESKEEVSVSAYRQLIDRIVAARE